jgi:predicted DNA-binding ribbon-helix-helix protein
MRSAVKRTTSVSKHSIFIARRKTSISLEDAFWDGLKEIAVARNIRLNTLLSEIDSKRQHAICRRPFGCSYWISIKDDEATN